MARVLSIILGGGKGTRLYPLTKYRSKPAVPFGGKHRIIDIPLSNCINSGFKNVYILTQFNSASLHIHIAKAYSFDTFSNGFVEILAAEQTFDHSTWYNGTADAVRKNLFHFRQNKPTHYLILSGDQLYRMNLKEFFHFHEISGSDITIACTPVTRDDASGFGIMKINNQSKIVEFMEKPPIDKDISSWKIPEKSQIKANKPEKEYLASMGIYLFSAKAMEECLDSDWADFGKEVIPASLKNYKVSAFPHNGYWTDIGTIRSFYEATLNLTEIEPDFDFYDAESPIYTHNRNLPTSKINAARLDRATCADGCVITNAEIRHSVIGVRSIIESGSFIEDTICMGSDYYESREEKDAARAAGKPCLGIGNNCKIRCAIIDKNVHIGNNVSIGMTGIKPDGDYGDYHVIDGIYVIVKNSVIPDNTVI